MQPGAAVQQEKIDFSLVGLLASNVVALSVAYATGMPLRELMIVYWIQSVIIGIISFLRLCTVAYVDTRNPVATQLGDRAFHAIFFVVHYGFFHILYLFFLGPFPPERMQSYLLCGLVFAAGHLYSFLRNFRRDRAGRPDISLVMWLPYARVLPMHLVILFGSSLPGGTANFLIFGALKIAADAVMHITEHRVLAPRR